MSGKKGSTSERYERLLDEAHKNISSDRERLISVIEDLKKESREDPDLASEIVKATVTVSEGLTRANALLVELVKVEAKRSGGAGGIDRLDEDDRKMVWDKLTSAAADGEN